MVFNNVELFNVEEAEPFDNGVILQRYTASAREDTKGHNAAWMACACMGCEVRFVTDSKSFWITLGAVTADCTVYVMCGDCTVQVVTIKSGEKKTIRIDGRGNIDNIGKDVFQKYCKRFSYDVWRFYFHSEGAIAFYGINAFGGTVRPPKPEEVPQKKMLAYGSSITHWCWAIDSRNSYIQQAAHRLNIDVYNKGMSGACHCEKSIADYLSTCNDYDIYFLELGVNMTHDFTVEDFRNRVEYLVKKITQCTDKNVILTGYYYSSDILKGNTEKINQFIDVLKNIKDKYNLKNLHYIDGFEIMDDPEYLCVDMVHPSDYGHIRMGENLAKILKEYL